MLVLAACGDTPDVNALNSELVAPPKEINVGPIFVGYPHEHEFELATRGALPLLFQTQQINDTDVFEILPRDGSIPINGSILITIRASANRLGLFETYLNIFTDASVGNPNARIRITAEGRLPPDCEDGNGCTNDRFDPTTQSCIYEQRDGPCDDRNRCTQNDLCRAGTCIGEPLVCEDNDVCTDNLCNPSVGCVFPATRSCNDNNPCTKDTCLSPDGCQHEPVENGTLCDDFEVCTSADVCFRGECIGIAIPDGANCDDGDPCSKNESCQDGECIDESYTRPGVQDVKYDTFVGRLAIDAGRNPIVDTSGNVFFGTELGAVALDICGEVLWRNDQYSEPQWSAAASLPGTLFVPIGTRIVSLDALDGMELAQFDLRAITSSTSTSTVTEVTIEDMVVRSSGNLLVSVREQNSPNGFSTGYLIEFNPQTNSAQLKYEFPNGSFQSLALTTDDRLAALLTLSSTVPTSTPTAHLIAYDMHLEEMSWIGSSTRSLPKTHFALGQDDKVYWSTGTHHRLHTMTGTTVLASTAIRNDLEHGGLTVGNDKVFWPVNFVPMGITSGASSSELVSTSTMGEIEWRRSVSGTLAGTQAAINSLGDVFIVSNNGVLYAFDRRGNEFFRYSTSPATDTYISNPTLTPTGVLVFGISDRIIGIQMSGNLAASPWPRYRHDNLSTGHQ